MEISPEEILRFVELLSNRAMDKTEPCIAPEEDFPVTGKKATEYCDYGFYTQTELLMKERVKRLEAERDALQASCDALKHRCECLEEKYATLREAIDATMFKRK